MGPLISFLLEIDRKTWTAFTERRKEEGRTAIGVLRILVQRYIDYGLDGFDELTRKPKNKDTK
jgi:hypothetical protein